MAIDYDIAGPTGYSSQNTGDTWARRYRVHSLPNTGIPQLIQDIYAEVPDNGTVGPSPLTHLVVARATIDEIHCASPTGLIEAYGTIFYSVPNALDNDPPPTGNDGAVISWSIASYTENEETTTDVNGTPIVVEDNDGVSRGRKITISQNRSRYALRRKEVNWPDARKKTYENKVNSLSWNGLAAGTVRCESISADSIDGGALQWDVSYSFLHKPSGWNQIRLVGDDIETGKPLAAPVGAQEIFIDEYEEVSFAPLNISFPT